MDPYDLGTDTDPPPDQTGEARLLVALPGLARIAASAWWRTTGWAAETSVRAGSRVLRAAVSGESPAELFQGASTELRRYLRRVMETTDPDDEAARRAPSRRRDGGRPSLRERGEELLRQSADVDFDEDEHPAYERILEELAPDEGRILRLLALDGPQPAIDVRTGGALGVGVGSELVEPGLNMIGAEAGCRYPDRIRSYLDNLNRLGLTWFSRESIPDLSGYQVLEAQPEAIEAMERAGRGRTVRRSIHLTPFGEDFCEACLPLHTAELDALPGAAAEPEDAPPEPPTPEPALPVSPEPVVAVAPEPLEPPPPPPPSPPVIREPARRPSKLRPIRRADRPGTT